MKSDNYLKQYLKYKNKYLQNKYILSGGFNIQDFEEKCILDKEEVFLQFHQK